MKNWTKYRIEIIIFLDRPFQEFNQIFHLNLIWGCFLWKFSHVFIGIPVRVPNTTCHTFKGLICWLFYRNRGKRLLSGGVNRIKLFQRKNKISLPWKNSVSFFEKEEENLPHFFDWQNSVWLSDKWKNSHSMIREPHSWI